MFHIMHYCESDLGFTNIVDWSIRKAGSEISIYCQLCQTMQIRRYEKEGNMKSWNN